MNLYFQKLVKDISFQGQRKKNIALIYEVEVKEETKIKYWMEDEEFWNIVPDNLGSRFPFLKRGEIIFLSDMFAFWDGNQVIENEVFDVHPFFYKYSTDSHGSWLTIKNRESIRNQA